MDQWWIYREGAIVGPVATDLVVRGLIAGKIPHDARVRADEVSPWVPILNIEAFVEATQTTTLLERPLTNLDRLEPKQPEGEGRFWFSPEWMLLEGETMSGPFSLDEIRSKRPPITAQVCRLHTFDWLKVDEAFALGSTKSDAPPAETLYLVHHVDGDQGPTSIDQLAKAHGAGRLKDDQLVSPTGSNERVALRALLLEHGLLRPKPMDRTVVVARKLGSEPPPDNRRALLLTVLALVLLLLGLVAFVLRGTQ